MYVQTSIAIAMVVCLLSHFMKHCHPPLFIGLVYFCSTGAGRTGVFITLCIVLERLQVESVVDIHRTVKTLRLERPFLIQTVDQYRFCFQVAVDYLRNFEMVA